MVQFRLPKPNPLGHLLLTSINNERRGQLILRMSGHSSQPAQSIFFKFAHFSNTLVSFGGALVLSGAVILAAMNILVVIYNSVASKKVPMLVNMTNNGRNSSEVNDK